MNFNLLNISELPDVTDGSKTDDLSHLNPVVLDSLLRGVIRTFLCDENALQSNYSSILTLIEVLISIENAHFFLFCFKWHFLISW